MSNLSSSPNTPSSPLPNSARRILIASLAGTTIEFFDFYIYATAAVLVFPKLLFPSSDANSAILESLATALPVVATAVGGNGELVEDRVNGRLFASGEDRVLADILLEYAQYSALRVQHGAAARAIAVARFSLAAMTNGYAAVYDQVLQLRR